MPVAIFWATIKKDGRLPMTSTASNVAMPMQNATGTLSTSSMMKLPTRTRIAIVSVVINFQSIAAVDSKSCWV